MTQDFLRSPEERTKERVFLCLCPGIDLVRLKTVPPQRIEFPVSEGLTLPPLAVIISPKTAMFE